MECSAHFVKLKAAVSIGVEHFDAVEESLRCEEESRGWEKAADLAECWEGE